MDLVLAPPIMGAPSRVDGGALAGGDSATTFGAATPGSAAGAAMAGAVRVGGSGGAAGGVAVALAPLDRDTSAAAVAPSAAAEGAGHAAHPAEAPPGSGPDLDHLANEVFDILRWRLAAERERLLA